MRINALVAKAQKTPEEGWIMQDGTPWPGNNSRDHPGMIQVIYIILLSRNFSLSYKTVTVISVSDSNYILTCLLVKPCQRASLRIYANKSRD